MLEYDLRKCGSKEDNREDNGRYDEYAFESTYRAIGVPVTTPKCGAETGAALLQEDHNDEKKCRNQLECAKCGHTYQIAS
jgi:hypothetical protein